MTCTKCGGLVVAGDEPGEWKCVQCSKRYYQPEAPEDRMGRCAAEGCKSQTKGAYCFSHSPAGVSAKDSVVAHDDGRKKGWSPERREKFMATMRAKGRVGKPSRDENTALVPAKPTTLTARPGRREPIAGEIVTELDAAILSRQREIEVLQQAKEILERC